MYEKIFANISTSIDKLGSFKLMEASLEDVDPRFLDIREDNLSDHVSMQPAAIAYFSSIKKYAQRQLEEMKEDFEHFIKVKKSETKAKMLSDGKKATVDDISNQVEIDFEEAIKDWNKKIREAQENFDNADSMFEAWKSKGFSLKVFADLAQQEFMTTDGVMKKESARDYQKRN